MIQGFRYSEKFRQAIKDEAKRLAEEGRPQADIALYLGVSQNTIGTWLRESKKERVAA